MKFGIDLGHNVRSDTGAIGIRKEDDLIVEVGTRVISKLRNRTHCNSMYANLCKQCRKLLVSKSEKGQR